MLLNEVFNNPEKQWTQDGNHVYAEIVSVQSYKTDQYGFKQPVTLRDIGGNQMAVTIQTKYEKGLCTPTMVGAKASWRLKWYGGQRGKQLVGYCLDKLPESGQATPQNAPQAPSQAVQASNAPKDVDWDAKDLRMARMSGLNNATRLICLLAETTKDIELRPDDRESLVNLVKEASAELVHYIYNGLQKPSQQQNVVKQAAAASPAMSGDDYGPPATDDEVVPDFLNEHYGDA